MNPKTQKNQKVSMTPGEIASVLDKHSKWLKGEKDGVRANLRGANLSGADLREANLSRANLREANLSRANLRGADLSRANLSGADLREANLSGANLRGADLTKADLREANLSGANLEGAYLSRADLREANLSGANLEGAYLSRANLTDVKGLDIQPSYTIIVPKEGQFIAYKKVLRQDKSPMILKLSIPSDAKRVNSIKGRKCRASKALVLEAIGGNEGEVFYSKHDPNFTYKVGQVVEPTKEFNGTFLNECTSGIHFFMTEEEARDY